MEKGQRSKGNRKDKSIVEKEIEKNTTNEAIQSEKLTYKHADEIYD